METNILVDIISQLETGVIICVFPVAAAAIMGGASLLGGLFSGLFGSSSSSETNAMNWEIAKLNYQAQQETNWNNMNMVRATNQSNEDIANKTNATNIQLQNDMNAFNKSMWNLNNDYNSPVQQLERARAAGINPNIVFGQPVASSPVQQTSIPNQVTPNLEAPQANAPQFDYRHNGSGKAMLKGISDLLNVAKELPFVKERLESMKLANQSQRLDNEVKEFEKWDREQTSKMYENFGVFKSPDGDYITPEEYEGLSSDEQRKFQPITSYRNTISDKEITPAAFDSLPDSQKHLYVPDYGLPEVIKSQFKSKEQFDTFKSLRALGSTLNNVRADNLQNILRMKVLSKQIPNNDVTSSLAFMPRAEFEKLGLEMKKTIEDIESLKAHNKNLAHRLETQDKMADYAASKMERDSKRDVIKIIQQYVPEGNIRDFLISAYAIFKDLK